MSLRAVAAGGVRHHCLQRLLASASPPLAGSTACGSSVGRHTASTGRRAFASGYHQFTGGFPGFDQPPPRSSDDAFYNLLGISRDASEAEIKSAYKKQAMKHHPDRGGDEARFKEISKAYEVLSDPEKRQVYDMYGEDGLNGEQAGFSGGGMHDPFELFQSIFGFNPGRRPQGKPRTPDQVYDMSLSLEEIYSGTSRNIVFNRDVLCKPCKGLGGLDASMCSQCNGTGVKVTLKQTSMFVQQFQSPCGACGSRGYVIPPDKKCMACNGKGTNKERRPFSVDVERGLKEGSEFRFKAQADEAPGHDTGDVVIRIKEKPHQTFQRTGDDLVMLKKLHLHEALCGFEFSTTFLDGQELTIRSKPGQVVRPDDVMVIDEKGMPRSHGQRPGNLYILFRLEFPERLSTEVQAKLSQALGAKPLSDVPSPTAELTRKLSDREVERLRQVWSQQAQAQSRGTQTQCAQM